MQIFSGIKTRPTGTVSLPTSSQLPKIQFGKIQDCLIKTYRPEKAFSGEGDIDAFPEELMRAMRQITSDRTVIAATLGFDFSNLSYDFFKKELELPTRSGRPLIGIISNRNASGPFNLPATEKRFKALLNAIGLDGEQAGPVDFRKESVLFLYTPAGKQLDTIRCQKFPNKLLLQFSEASNKQATWKLLLIPDSVFSFKKRINAMAPSASSNLYTLTNSLPERN